MAQYFSTVLKPRIQKAIYSKDWVAGKPVSREGISHMFKYIRLESYEDALNNLKMEPTPQQKLAFDGDKDLRDTTSCPTYWTWRAGEANRS